MSKYSERLMHRQKRGLFLHHDLWFSTRVLEVGSMAFGAWVQALLWCATYTHELDVPHGILKRVIKPNGVQSLVDAGMLVPCEGGYQIVNFEVGHHGHPAFRFYEGATETAARWDRGGCEAVVERDGAACRYCGSTERLSIDHVVPRCRGGGDDEANLVVACRSCNSRKGGRTSEQAGMVLRPAPEAAS